MAYRQQIPQELLDKYPQYTQEEIRAMINTVWKSVHNIMRQSQVFRISIPGIGVIRSHGNKKLKYKENIRKRDVIRKRKETIEKSFERDNLLF